MQQSNHDDRQSILVVGAGELGLSVIRALVERAGAGGTSISVLLRPQANDSPPGLGHPLLTELQALHVSVLYADIARSTAEELAMLFRSFHTVVNCTGFVGGPGTQLKLGSAALIAGVNRYVPWQFGVDYDTIETGSAGGIFDEQIAVRRLMRSQAETAWVIVSTGMFTSFLFEPAFDVANLEARTVNALGSWDTSVTVTTPRDIGRLTADILNRQAPDESGIFFVAGETITYRRLAELVEEAIGAPVQRTEWTIEMLQRDLAEQPDNVMRKYRLAFAQEPGVAWPMSATYNQLHAIRTDDVAAFLDFFEGANGGA